MCVLEYFQMLDSLEEHHNTTNLTLRGGVGAQRRAARRPEAQSAEGVCELGAEDPLAGVRMQAPCYVNHSEVKPDFNTKKRMA